MQYADKNVKKMNIIGTGGLIFNILLKDRIRNGATHSTTCVPHSTDIQ